MMQAMFVFDLIIQNAIDNEQMSTAIMTRSDNNMQCSRIADLIVHLEGEEQSTDHKHFQKSIFKKQALHEELWTEAMIF